MYVRVVATILIAISATAIALAGAMPGPQHRRGSAIRPVDAQPGQLSTYSWSWDRKRLEVERDRVRGPKQVRNAAKIEKLSAELFSLAMVVNPVDRKGILKRTTQVESQAQAVWESLADQMEPWSTGRDETVPPKASNRRPVNAAEDLYNLARGVRDDVTADAKAATPDPALRKQILCGLQRMVVLAREVKAGYSTPE